MRYFYTILISNHHFIVIASIKSDLHMFLHDLLHQVTMEWYHHYMCNTVSVGFSCLASCNSILPLQHRHQTSHVHLESNFNTSVSSEKFKLKPCFRTLWSPVLVLFLVIKAIPLTFLLLFNHYRNLGVLMVCL